MEIKNAEAAPSKRNQLRNVDTVGQKSKYIIFNKRKFTIEKLFDKVWKQKFYDVIFEHQKQF